MSSPISSVLGYRSLLCSRYIFYFNHCYYSVFSRSSPASDEIINSLKELKIEKENIIKDEKNNNNDIPSGSPSLEAINRLRSTGRNRDPSESYDRFAKAMEYRKKKENKQ